MGNELRVGYGIPLHGGMDLEPRKYPSGCWQNQPWLKLKPNMRIILKIVSDRLSLGDIDPASEGVLEEIKGLAVEALGMEDNP